MNNYLNHQLVSCSSAGPRHQDLGFDRRWKKNDNLYTYIIYIHILVYSHIGTNLQSTYIYVLYAACALAETVHQHKYKVTRGHAVFLRSCKEFIFHLESWRPAWQQQHSTLRLYFKDFMVSRSASRFTLIGDRSSYSPVAFGSAQKRPSPFATHQQRRGAVEEARRRGLQFIRQCSLSRSLSLSLPLRRRRRHYVWPTP